MSIEDAEAILDQWEWLVSQEYPHCLVFAPQPLQVLQGPEHEVMLQQVHFELNHLQTVSGYPLVAVYNRASDDE